MTWIDAPAAFAGQLVADRCEEHDRAPCRWRPTSSQLCRRRRARRIFHAGIRHQQQLQLRLLQCPPPPPGLEQTMVMGTHDHPERDDEQPTCDPAEPLDHSDMSSNCSSSSSEVNLLDLVHDTIADIDERGWVDLQLIVNTASQVVDVSLDDYMRAIDEWQRLGVMSFDPKRTMVKFMVPPAPREPADESFIYESDESNGCTTWAEPGGEVQLEEDQLGNAAGGNSCLGEEVEPEEADPGHFLTRADWKNLQLVSRFHFELASSPWADPFGPSCTTWAELGEEVELEEEQPDRVEPEEQPYNAAGGNSCMVVVGSPPPEEALNRSDEKGVYIFDSFDIFDETAAEPCVRVTSTGQTVETQDPFERNPPLDLVYDIVADIAERGPLWVNLQQVVDIVAKSVTGGEVDLNDITGVIMVWQNRKIMSLNPEKTMVSFDVRPRWVKRIVKAYTNFLDLVHDIIADLAERGPCDSLGWIDLRHVAIMATNQIAVLAAQTGHEHPVADLDYCARCIEVWHSRKIMRLDLISGVRVVICLMPPARTNYYELIPSTNA